MTREGIAKLLETIGMHYPGFARNITTDSGKIRTAVVEEWYIRIGFLDYETSNRMLGEYLKAEHKTAPGVGYFLNITPRTKIKDLKLKHTYHVGNAGELLDEAECEYCNPENIDEIYYYMGNRIIVTATGRVVQGYPTGKPQLKKCCGNCCKYDRGACCGRLQDIEDCCTNWKIKKYMQGAFDGR